MIHVTKTAGVSPGVSRSSSQPDAPAEDGESQPMVASGWCAAWVSPAVLAGEGIQISTGMFSDHFPDVIERGLREAHASRASSAAARLRVDPHATVAAADGSANV
jgi:hypothetical protein